MSEPRTPLGMRLSAVALLLGIFVAGAGAGAALYRWGSQERFPMNSPSEMRLPIPWHELGLSPEQQQRAEAILRKHHPELEAILRENFPRVKAVQEKIDAELRQLLNDEQCQKFDAIKARRPDGPPPMGMMRGWMGRPPGRPPFHPPDAPPSSALPIGMPTPSPNAVPGTAGASH